MKKIKAAATLAYVAFALVMSISVAISTARQDTPIDGVLAFLFSVGVFGVIWRVGRWVARHARRAES